MESGEYVRDKEGHIDKVESYSNGCCTYKCKNGMIIDECNIVGTHLSDIVKHSKNIIDLIEIGDYVNGYRVDVKESTLLTTIIRGIDKSVYYVPISQYGEEIKSILTKEQYENNCYKIKE